MSNYRPHFDDPLNFFKQRCRRATHHSEWTAGATLYAHYRRWAYLRDNESNSISTFYTKLNKLHGKRRREQHGIDLWPLWIKNKRPKLASATRCDCLAPPPAKRGRVRVLQDMSFCDGLLVAGTELDWMEPSVAERHYLDLEYRRQQDDGVSVPVSWMVVVFLDRRRRVAADMVEMLI